LPILQATMLILAFPPLKVHWCKKTGVPILSYSIDCLMMGGVVLMGYQCTRLTAYLYLWIWTNK